MVLQMDHDQVGRRQLHPRDNYLKDQSNWVIIEDKVYDVDNNIRRTSTLTPSSSSSSIGEDSTVSNGSSSLDTTDDASSYSSGSSLYDLSDLMSQLPIKRGLSKFYQGKSQSFTCLSRVGSIEDLVKKESPYNNKRRLMKASLDNYKSYTLPKPLISKKTTSRGSLISSSSSFPNRKANFLISNIYSPLASCSSTAKERKL